MKFAIAGASGLIGQALTDHLTTTGHTVVPMIRVQSDSASAAGEPARVSQTGASVIGDANPIGWDPAAGVLDPGDLVGVDVVVNLAGPGIADRRWSDEYRAVLKDARVDATALIAGALARLADDSVDGRPTMLINASAIGFYGDRGEAELDETSPAGTGFLPELCAEWEAATQPAAAAGVGVAIVRTGIVLTRSGGALSKLIPQFRFGLGGRFGSGDQWMSWISMRDETRAIEFIAETGATGLFNLTAPNPVRNRDFASTLASALHRPSRLPVPAFGPRLVLGRDLANALLFDSARVMPHALEAAEFSFADPDLAGALASILG